MLQGIDVSNWQGAVDWQAVKASGVTFAFAKATEGTGFLDPYFTQNWANMRAAGLVRGAYAYAQPDYGPPNVQADWFLSCVGPLSAGDLLALDLEEGSGPLGDWAYAFLQRVEERAGVRPVLYTGQWFIDAHGLADARLAEYGLWLASWQQTFPPVPKPWPVIAFWQFTATGAVRGVPGDCDRDAFNGDAAALARYGYQPAPEPAPQPDRLRDAIDALTISRDAFLTEATEAETLAAGLRAHAQGIDNVLAEMSR